MMARMRTGIGQEPAAMPTTSGDSPGDTGEPPLPKDMPGTPLAKPGPKAQDRFALIGSRFGLIITWGLMILVFSLLMPGVFLVRGAAGERRLTQRRKYESHHETPSEAATHHSPP